MTTVLFDTNSYRQFVNGKTIEEVVDLVAELVSLEQEKEIRSYAVSVVGMELMANIAEGENGINYDECLKSLICMSRHCFESSTKLTRLIPPPFFHVAQLIFGILPINYNQQWLNIANLYNQFQLQNGLPKNFFTKENFYDDLKNRFQGSEEAFSNNIVNLINNAKTNVGEEHPNLRSKFFKKKLLEYLKSERCSQLLALGLLTDVANELGIQPNLQDLNNMAHYMRQKLPLTIGFFEWITTKIVESNIDMQSKTSKDKRWNWLWDFQLTFLISDRKIDGGEILLVTSDKDISNMIKQYGFKNKVVTIQEYLVFLKS